MQVGDLVKCKITGEVSMITWVSRHGAHFKVMGYPVNQVFNTERWGVVNENR